MQTPVARLLHLSGTLLLAALILIFSPNTFAETFKCEQNGAISYSDKPCTNPLPLQLPSYKPAEKNAGRAALSDKEKYHQINSKLESARKERAAKRRIASLKTQIEETELTRQQRVKELREKIDALEFNNADMDDDINAEAQEQALNAQIKRVNDEFRQKLNALRSEKDALQQQVEAMNPAY